MSQRKRISKRERNSEKDDKKNTLKIGKSSAMQEMEDF